MPSVNFLLAQLSIETSELLNLTYKHEGIATIADSYRKNINRVGAPYMLMLDVCRLTKANTQVAAIIATRHEGSLEEFEAWVKIPTNQDYLINTTNQLCEQSVENYQKAKEFFCAGIEPRISAENQMAVMHSMIVSAWTAFEVMSGDLWETALNIHPIRLASLTDHVGKMEKTIKLEFLEKNGYDLSHCMGTVHREARKFNFQKLGEDGIRAAFLASFRKDGKDVATAIENQAHDALSLIRNLIVHKGGIIDQIFLNESRNITSLEKWNKLPPKTVLELNGDDTAALLNASVLSSIALIKAVDAWLSVNA